jgi:hypothetical protein
MISTRWSTENRRSLTRESRAQPVPPQTAPKLLERPEVKLGIAVAAGFAIGLLVKWGWRR